MSYTIQNTPVKLCFQPLSARTLRISLLPAGESVPQVFSTLDLSAAYHWEEPAVSLDGSAESPRLAIGDFCVSVSEHPLSVTVQRSGKLIQTLSFCETSGQVSFPLGQGALFGLGHGFTQQMNRRGGDYDLRTNGQVRGLIEHHSAVSPSPYVISTEGWALHFHQPWKADLDLSGDMGRFSQYPHTYCDVFVVACDEPLDAPREYYTFTGLPPMPPKYAFGYQQSYRTLLHNDVNYVVKTAEYMREKEIPCDVLVYLGTGYCDNGWNTYNGNFEWHPDVFPNPAETMQQLHDLDYKVSLHVTRCYTGLHGSIHDENVSPLEYDHAKNYWKKHIELYGTAKNEAWWPDDADEVDMEQRLTRWKMYYEGSLDLNPDIRPFQMQRNTFPGANQYGGIIWSGDILSEWETLKNQVPIGLNVALSCSPFWGTDTGGFFSTAEYDGELFIRWMQYSTFTPFFRAHGRSSFLHNPWGFSMFESLDELPLELCPGMLHDAPPAADILPDHRVEPLCKQYINLRYELMPYLYSLSHEACEGVPMMRPLWCYYPEDQTAVATDSEYLLGEHLLVAPVTAKGAETWEVYLPEGLWYDYWTKTSYTGGKTYTVAAPLDRIPLFIRAGGVLAKAPVVQSIPAEKPQGFESLTLELYTGTDGSYTLYEDDGISLGYQQGKCTKTTVNWKEDAKQLDITGTSALFPGQSREIEVVLLPEGTRKTVTVQYQ